MRDLGAQPQELRKSRHQDVAVLRDHLRLQGLHGFAAPYLHAFRNHAHRIDDLGVAGHRFRRQVCPGAVAVCLVERDRGDPLVQQRHDDQGDARAQHDEPELRMDQEHDGEIGRRDRRIEHRQQYRPGEERAEVLQVGQRLEFAAGSTLRGFGGGAQHGSAQFGFGLDRNPHQDEAAHHVHQHMRRDRDDHDNGQHHQRIGAAAGQHAIGHVEQIDRYGQHQQIDHDREDPDGHHVAAGARKTLAEHVAEFIVAGTLVQRRRTAAATSPAASTAGGTSTVLVASAFERGRRTCLLDHDGGSRRRGLCLLAHRWLDGRRLALPWLPPEKLSHP